MCAACELWIRNETFLFNKCQMLSFSLFFSFPPSLTLALSPGLYLNYYSTTFFFVALKITTCESETSFFLFVCLFVCLYVMYVCMFVCYVKCASRINLLLQSVKSIEYVVWQPHDHHHRFMCCCCCPMVMNTECDFWFNIQFVTSGHYYYYVAEFFINVGLLLLY